MMVLLSEMVRDGVIDGGIYSSHLITVTSKENCHVHVFSYFFVFLGIFIIIIFISNYFHLSLSCWPNVRCSCETDN